MSVMIERLEGMVNRYHEITDLMMMPEVASDSRQLAKLGREQAELTQVVETYTEYRKTAEALEEAKTLLHEEDKEMREMARMEIEELEPKQEELLQKLELLLIPKDPNDSHNAFLEVRGAAGGDEGNIFAGDLLAATGYSVCRRPKARDASIPPRRPSWSLQRSSRKILRSI